MTDIQVTE